MNREKFHAEFAFAELHMQSVKDVLGSLPSKTFFDVQSASAKRDMEEATDLVLSISSGDIAVRVRRKGAWSIGKRLKRLDWSVRARNNGHKTEIHKLKDGFARWYFYAYSKDDRGCLQAWWLIDMDKVRDQRILDIEWDIHENGDGSAGMYIPFDLLELMDCVVAKG